MRVAALVVVLRRGLDVDLEDLENSFELLFPCHKGGIVAAARPPCWHVEAFGCVEELR